MSNNTAMIKGWIMGFTAAVFITSILFMENSTYNGALLDRGLLEYNKTTGDLQYAKGCTHENK